MTSPLGRAGTPGGAEAGGAGDDQPRERLMSDIVLDRVQRALRGVVAGGERARVVAETLAGVVDAARASGGVLLAMIDGQPAVIGRNGADAEAAAEAGRAALLSGRLTR